MHLGEIHNVLISSVPWDDVEVQVWLLYHQFEDVQNGDGKLWAGRALGGPCVVKGF